MSCLSSATPPLLRSSRVDAVQIGAQAMAVAESLTRRIAATGGAALLIDYGADRPYANSLTGKLLAGEEPTAF